MNEQVQPRRGSWTKADRKRIDDVLLFIRREASDRFARAPDDVRQAFNNEFSAVHVAEYMRAIPYAREKDQRAALRLAAKIEAEGLPEGVELPRLVLQREIDEQREAERRAEIERAEEAERRAEQARARFVPPPIDIDRERRQLGVQIGHTLARGEVHVAQVDGSPFGLDCSWRDADPLTLSWRELGRSSGIIDEEDGRRWDRITDDSELARKYEHRLVVLWERVCSELLVNAMPAVLDLSGMPRSDANALPNVRWLDALGKLLRRCKRGVVVLVDGEAWAVARLLPHRVGGGA